MDRVWRLGIAFYWDKALEDCEASRLELSRVIREPRLIFELLPLFEAMSSAASRV
jgi:hypothetical protein